MISEAAGATPFGIFLLADDFLMAATTSNASQRIRTGGPARLLCVHAIELFLKAYLRQRGQDIDTLRAYGHRLSDMAEAAESCGLTLSISTRTKLDLLTNRNDYVRVRYMVVDTPADIKPNAVLALTENVREAVRFALEYDEFGNPTS